jgi:hypothetical protein
MQRLLAWALAAPVLFSAGRASAVSAEDKLSQANKEFEAAEFDHALETLRVAERLTSDPKLLGPILIQTGLVQDALRHPEDAVVSFVRALRCAPATRLRESDHKRSTLRLFFFAKALVDSGIDDRALVEKLGEPALRATSDACRAPSPSGTASPAALVETAPPERTGRWPAWLLAGTAVGAGGVGVALGVSARVKDDACQKVGDPATYATCNGEASGRELAANIALGTAAAAAVLALAWWLLD